MRSYHLLFAIFFVLVLLACPTSVSQTQVASDSSASLDTLPAIPVTGGAEFTGCGQRVIIPVQNDAFEQSVVEQTNQIRMAAGLSPLKRVGALSLSARYHAADMSNNNYFDHNTYDRVEDQLVGVCDTWNRISGYYTGWLALAENIAAGQPTPEEVVNAWMNSPDHRENILSDQYSEIGVGYYQGQGEYLYYWGQNFGRQQGSFPLVIAGEQARTSQREVSVYIYGEWSEARFQIDSGPWSDWMPFYTHMTALLPEYAGMHTISAEMRRWDASATASDTIEFVP